MLLSLVRQAFAKQSILACGEDWLFEIAIMIETLYSVSVTVIFVHCLEVMPSTFSWFVPLLCHAHISRNA